MPPLTSAEKRMSAQYGDDKETPVFQGRSWRKPPRSAAAKTKSLLRLREKQRAKEALATQQKIVREVIVPETITVGELANRMAERSGDVIRVLMKMGVMASLSQLIEELFGIVVPYLIGKYFWNCW